VAELDIGHAALRLEKTRFTMFGERAKEFLEARSIAAVVLFGVEVSRKWPFALQVASTRRSYARRYKLG
jgi:hypothetical protein